VATAKSPAGGRGRPKSTSPKQKRAPARGRRSRTSAKDEEEHAEEQEEEKEDEDKEEEEEEDSVAAAAAPTDEEKVDPGAEAMDESEPAGDVKSTGDEDTDGDVERLDTEPQPTPALHADNSVTEDSPRKRKFDEIEDESDDEEEAGAKVLKVSEEGDVKTAASVEAPVEDGELTSGAEVATAEPEVSAQSKLSLPLSTETDIEDDYIVITPDDVPPVDSDEVMNTAAKMIPSSASASCSNDTLLAVDIPNPLLHREYTANPAILSGPADTSRSFTLGSYNILADYHAQKDYGFASWLTSEQLSLSSRHQRLIEELIYLDEDVICLQEVGGDYMNGLLQPTLER